MEQAPISIPYSGLFDHTNKGGRVTRGEQLYSVRATDVDLIRGSDKLPVGGAQSISQIPMSRTVTPVRMLSSKDGGIIYEWVVAPMDPIKFTIEGTMYHSYVTDEYHRNLIGRVQGEASIANISVPDLNAWLSPMDIAVRFTTPDGGYLYYWYLNCVPDNHTIRGIDIGGNNVVMESLSLNAARMGIEWKQGA